MPSWLPELLVNATHGVRWCAASPKGDCSGSGFAPDGAFWEGPIYGGYAARYFIPFATAMAGVTGDDQGLFELAGVGSLAHANMLAMDPSWSYFNWADAEEGQETLSVLLSVAARAGDGALRERLDAARIPFAEIDYGMQDAMVYAHALVYFSDYGSAQDRAIRPLDAALPSKLLAYFRSSWTDPKATFVGLKGCNCSFGHGDLDSGTFVYTTGGHRFVNDLGADNYVSCDGETTAAASECVIYLSTKLFPPFYLRPPSPPQKQPRAQRPQPQRRPPRHAELLWPRGERERLATRCFQ